MDAQEHETGKDLGGELHHYKPRDRYLYLVGTIVSNSAALDYVLATLAAHLDGGDPVTLARHWTRSGQQMADLVGAVRENCDEARQAEAKRLADEYMRLYELRNVVTHGLYVNFRSLRSGEAPQHWVAKTHGYWKTLPVAPWAPRALTEQRMWQLIRDIGALIGSVNNLITELREEGIDGY